MNLRTGSVLTTCSFYRTPISINSEPAQETHGEERKEHIMMNSIFGGVFDFDRDGELDSFERAMEFQFLEELEREEDYDDDDYDDYDDCDDY